MNTEELYEELHILKRRNRTLEHLLSYYKAASYSLRQRNCFLVKANRIYFAVGTAGTIIGFLLGWLVV